MTTAHRPTYFSIRGKNTIGLHPTMQYSSKDMPAHKMLKYRQETNLEETNISNNAIKAIYDYRSKYKNTLPAMKKDLISREKKSNQKENDNFKELPMDINYQLPLKEDSPDLSNSDHSENDIEEPISNNKKRKLNDDEIDSNKLKEKNFEQDKDVEYSNENEDNDSLDEEEELKKELEKIKQQQLEEKIKKDEELKEKTQNEILKGNPLLNQTSESFISNNNSYSLKKKWYEETVFRNQCRIEEKPKKRFINDTLRNDFHKKFLTKTIP